MPIIHGNPTITFSKAETNLVTLAIQLMEDRSVKTFFHNVGSVKIYGGRYRLLYKEYQGITPHYNNIKQHPKIRVEIHHMQVIKIFLQSLFD